MGPRVLELALAAARPTPHGALALAWSRHGIGRILVGEPSTEAALARLATEHDAVACAEPPSEVLDLLASLAQELDGEPADHRAVRLDERALSPFRRAAHRVLRAVPRGSTVTYAELAAAVGRPGAARAIGRVLGANPFPLVVPCHRVIAAGGRFGGFSLPGGVATKARLLGLEASPDRALGSPRYPERASGPRSR